MICPILEAIRVVDDVTAKMNYFLDRWGRGEHGGLIDEMRQFFTETFWHLHEMGCSNDTKGFILSAERSMNNIIKMWSDRQAESVRMMYEPAWRVPFPRVSS